jgi:hypothetical protein
LPGLRFTRRQAEAEAICLSTEFVSDLPDAASSRCIGAYADEMAPKSRSTKIPVVWVVGFVFHPPEVVMDGGELFVTVDLETKVVAIRE